MLILHSIHPLPSPVQEKEGRGEEGEGSAKYADPDDPPFWPGVSWEQPPLLGSCVLTTV